MEIEFELDNGFVCGVEPDFDLPLNCCDTGKVTWTFQDGTHSGTVASMLGSTSEYEYTTTYLLSAL
jgi:hypothetical protein